MFGFKNHWRKEKIGRCPKCNAVNEDSHKALEKFLTEGPPETPREYANKDVMRDWIKSQDKLLHTLHRVLMSSIAEEFVKHELEKAPTTWPAQAESITESLPTITYIQR